MNLIKRMLCMALTLAMLLSLAPFSFPADAAPPLKKTGTFYYSGQEMQDYPSTYFYDDGYFRQSAYVYQDSLSTMSLCLAMAGFNSYRTPEGDEGYALKTRNLEDMLVQCGFPAENFGANEGYTTRPTADSVGVAASHKSLTLDGETYTLLAVVARGGNYEIEWASNFTLGETGEHQGFAEAREQALSFLKSYVTAHQITGRVKLWITGYSRGAVTANMTAAALDDGFYLGSGIQLDPEDLYAYCFECPQGTLDPNRSAEVYGNIFNIVNPADFVTKLAPTIPSQFGFGRYGVDIVLPTPHSHPDTYPALRDTMLKHYYALLSVKPYTVDDFQMKKIDARQIFGSGLISNNNDPKWSQSAFIEEFYLKFFGDLIQSRSNYVTNYQDDFRTLSCILFRSEKQTELFGEKLVNNITGRILEVAVCLVLNQEDKLTDIVKDVVLQSMQDAGMTEYSEQDVEDMTRVLVKLLLSFGRSHPDLTITLVSNLNGIAGAHYAELCLAWLQSLDYNYTAEGSEAFLGGVDGVYRVSGKNRYETALAAADMLKQQQKADRFSTIVVASGTDFPDALAGNYLASAFQAPILLVNKQSMDTVSQYITDHLTPDGTVYLLGGEAAVPSQMEDTLSGFHLIRLAGKNRYETNLAILKATQVSDQEILVCTGTDFADSLSASAVSCPILLVRNTLTEAQHQFLASAGGSYTIIGGENAVSKAVEEELSEHGPVRRIGGKNRHETSVLVAQTYFNSPQSIVLAYSRNFPDGLCGGPLAIQIGAPLILTAPKSEAAASRYTQENSISTGLILGGTSVIPEDCANQILGY